MRKLFHISIFMVMLAMVMPSCRREPELHLHYGDAPIDVDIPIVDLEFDLYWDYFIDFGIDYNWRAEWYYGWDDIDEELFGKLEYDIPNTFELRRYFTGSTAYASHTSVLSTIVEGTHFNGYFDWGFWDVLAWNDIQTLDGVQSLRFDEATTLDYVTAHTGENRGVQSRYAAPVYAHPFWQPEALFAGYEQAVEINRNLDGFVYDEENNVWRKTINLRLEPRTYVYLTQVIIHNNGRRNTISAVDGEAQLSGMARSINLNTGVAGSDAISVYYNVRLKRGVEMPETKESVDIVGGRVQSFGIRNVNANRISRLADDGSPNSANDGIGHYLQLTMQFQNGMDSTFVFDVTNQVRKRFKGGVITVELDMDTVPTPTRSGGSGFDAVVVDYEDGGTHEFDM